MLNILIASPIDPDALEKLQNSHSVICAYGATTDKLQAQIKECNVLIFRSGVKISAEVMECAPDLELIIRAGSGIDNLDIDYMQRRGIELKRIPEPGAKAVAEMSFALMLALSRNLIEVDRMTKQGRWIKHETKGYLLTGKTLGVIGVGNIGSRVARLGEDWGMEVIGCVEHPSPERSKEFDARGIRLMDFYEVISRADYISIHVPLKDSTRNLIDSKAFEAMKFGVYLVNLARGGVVDEEALYKAMTDGGRVRGAALDVHKEEGEGKISILAGLPTVILTPHIGAMTIDSQREIGNRILEMIQQFETKHALDTLLV